MLTHILSKLSVEAPISFSATLSFLLHTHCTISLTAKHRQPSPHGARRCPNTCWKSYQTSSSSRRMLLKPWLPAVSVFKIRQIAVGTSCKKISTYKVSKTEITAVNTFSPQKLTPCNFVLLYIFVDLNMLCQTQTDMLLCLKVCLQSRHCYDLRHTCE